ncbi:alpha/beta-hydrolase [Stipitochalara longipes BDJ]|nr:alpha/beta-hydrolase [Stipitochalara longipes BDJ]
MILGQVSWLDCFVFLIFLAPQLVIHVGFFPTLFCGLRALPFLLLRLPLTFIYERLLLSREHRSPFVQQASWFEDIVIRCVRYAFAYIPASIGRVFFSKWVALPFLKFRMLRHGYIRSPFHWHEVNEKEFKGVWLIKDQYNDPDIVIYYSHGGGFSMGSSYFYLEFLLALLSLLSFNFKNPAILSLEYSLVPDASHPTQLHQAIAGYKYLQSLLYSSKIVVSGDSAGASIILSLLLYLGNNKSGLGGANGFVKDEPGMAVLISPWITLISPKDKNTASDYLDADNLHQYAKQYAGNKISVNDPLISPGKCKDVASWRKGAPEHGFFIAYGAEEVFAPEIRDLISLLEKANIIIEYQEEKGGIHAWPVASLFLCSTSEERTKGLREIVKQISERMGSGIPVLDG